VSGSDAQLAGAREVVSIGATAVIVTVTEVAAHRPAESTELPRGGLMIWAVGACKLLLRDWTTPFNAISARDASARDLGGDGTLEDRSRQGALTVEVRSCCLHP
jgi:hypothetical protein